MENLILKAVYTQAQKDAALAAFAAEHKPAENHSALYNALTVLYAPSFRAQLDADGKIAGYQYTGYRFAAPGRDCFATSASMANLKSECAHLAQICKPDTPDAEIKAAYVALLTSFSNVKLQERFSATDAELPYIRYIFGAMVSSVDRTTGALDFQSIKAGAAFKAMCIVIHLKIHNKKLTRANDESLAKAINAAKEATAKEQAAAAKRAENPHGASKRTTTAPKTEKK